VNLIVASPTIKTRKRKNGNRQKGVNEQILNRLKIKENFLYFTFAFPFFDYFSLL